MRQIRAHKINLQCGSLKYQKGILNTPAHAQHDNLATNFFATLQSEPQKERQSDNELYFFLLFKDESAPATAEAAAHITRTHHIFCSQCAAPRISH
jgi:hypothetical protein